MTAGPYAAATGLIERFAGAYSCAVPVSPRDDRFFGPASVTWRVSANLSAPVAFLRWPTCAARWLPICGSPAPT